MAPYIFKNSLVLFLVYSLAVTTASTPTHSTAALCHDHERSALLHFKQSLSLNKSASSLSSAYPKTESWKHRSDCCSWSGVECNNKTGHVIGLHLSSSLLYGTLPSNSTIFTLVHLQTLKLDNNDFQNSLILPGIIHLLNLSILDLTFSAFSGQIPLELAGLSKLTSLDLSSNNFTGNLPDWIGNLQSLTKLRLRECYFSGSIPASIGNLTQLTYLSLSYNLFNKHNKLSWLDKLTKLTVLDLEETNLHGNIPLSLANLTHLTVLHLEYNNLVGKIPLWLINMTHLTELTLGSNDLTGPIPNSFAQLKNLEHLSLRNNSFIGVIKADIFLSLPKLTLLSVSYNKITLLTNHHINFTVPKLEILDLYSCNLREIPYFLKFQNNLEILNLGENNIHGKIPYWIWNASDSLQGINLSFNFLTSIEHNPIAFPCKSLKAIDISNNMLQGDLPVPPPNTVKYVMVNNRLTGYLSSMICNCTFLEVLDLSNNSMSGPIPRCLGNISDSLVALVLQNNNFSGTIPEPYPKECTLKVLDLSQNQLKGKVPKSLSNCGMLQILDLSNNQLEETFPMWLGTIPRLQVLILHSNKFHGVIASPRMSFEFPALRIIDLSHNYLTGDLPVKYIQTWNAMRTSRPDTELYITTQVTYQIQNKFLLIIRTTQYSSSITLKNKGVKKNYEKILNVFTSVDLSSNKFTGYIPESFGSLEALQSLDLSNNELTGPIPRSFGNLKQLESLDLSHNKLSGSIPQQLARELNFLEFFNVSYNLLSGHIPQVPHFETFDNNSYIMNSGLCGFPLSKTCGTVQSEPADDGNEDEDESDADEFLGGFVWIFILAGLGSGFVVGIVLGNLLVDKHPWLIASVVHNLGETLKNRRRPKRQNGRRPKRQNIRN